MSIRVLAAAAALGALTTSARAQDRGNDFEWRRQLPSGSELRLHNVNGNVTVTQTSGNTVEIIGHIVGRRGAGNAYVEVHEFSRGVVACVMWRGADGECSEDNYSMHSRHHDDDDDNDTRGQIDLEVRAPAGMQVMAGSVSGDVEVSGAAGDVRAHSVSGNVRVESGRVTSLDVGSVSGNVEARVADLSGSGRMHASSVSGNIRLELPRQFDADVRMSTVSGSLDSDFPITMENQTRRGRRIEGRIGQGGRPLELSTVSGDVRLIASR